MKQKRHTPEEIIKKLREAEGVTGIAKTAVRLTRLPGVIRGDNGNEQRLIWLNPHPTPMPLEQFSKLR